jgi:hypothetical protein
MGVPFSRFSRYLSVFSIIGFLYLSLLVGHVFAFSAVIEDMHEVGCSNQFYVKAVLDADAPVPRTWVIKFDIDYSMDIDNAPVVIENHLQAQSEPTSRYELVRFGYKRALTGIFVETDTYWVFNRTLDGGNCPTTAAVIEGVNYSDTHTIESVDVRIYESEVGGHGRSPLKNYELFYMAESSPSRSSGLFHTLGNRGNTVPVDMSGFAPCQEIGFILKEENGTPTDGKTFLNGFPNECFIDNGSCQAKQILLPNNTYTCGVDPATNYCETGMEAEIIDEVNCSGCRCIDPNDPPECDYGDCEYVPPSPPPPQSTVFSVDDLKGFASKWHVYIIAIALVLSVFLLPYIGVLMASGDPEKIQKGKDWLWSLLTGLFLLLLSGTVLKIVGVDILQLG